MLYCEKCNSLTGGDRCPVCGGALRQPETNDYILFAVREQMWAEMFIDALRDNGVDAASKPVMDAGLTAKLGMLGEELQIYIPYGSVSLANEISDLMFGEDFEE